MQCEDLVGLLAKISGGIQAVNEEVRNDWLPDDPPITTLFAAFGYRIAEEFDSLDSDANSQIFALIEKAMKSDDSVLVTAVATGLIEALVTRAIQDEGLGMRITSLLGPQSLHHAKVWLDM